MPRGRVAPLPTTSVCPAEVLASLVMDLFWPPTLRKLDLLIHLYTKKTVYCVPWHSVSFSVSLYGILTPVNYARFSAVPSLQKHSRE